MGPIGWGFAGIAAGLIPAIIFFKIRYYRLKKKSDERIRNFRSNDYRKWAD